MMAASTTVASRCLILHLAYSIQPAARPLCQLERAMTKEPFAAHERVVDVVYVDP